MAQVSKPPAICNSGSLSGPCTELDIGVTRWCLAASVLLPYGLGGKKADANRFPNLHHASQGLAVFFWLAMLNYPHYPILSIHYTLFHIRLISGGYPQIH